MDIGGRRIQIDCRGTGSPVVVFESNDLWGSLSWSAVQDSVAATTRACSYSRAGILWSDPGAGLRDDKVIAFDLHAVLERAGERPPFVLVGQSLAGLYAVSYTQYFGAEVAGLVLVDPAHPDNDAVPIGVSLGTWNGVSCAIVIAKDSVMPVTTNNSSQGTLTGRATAAGNLCVRVYDVGFVAGSANYELLIDHY